ncbi:MAG: secondary thiamine-phosphate synthase enzyme YjbQ [Archaeoglobaceae archaeon]|nr:secondary thiamine-phosphate synthase enzyme YjbQ [Archaeoglobales archaeon]
MNALEVKTTKRTEIVDITEKVEGLLKGSGIALIYTPHTTASVILNEAESGLLEDILKALEKIVPKNASYRHNEIDNNAEAHIKASLLGNSVLIPFENGKLQLGTWQRVLFLEFDGPRTRKVFVRVL